MEEEIKQGNENIQEEQELTKEQLIEKLSYLEKEYEVQKERCSKLEALVRASNEKLISLNRELEQLKEHYRKEREQLKKYAYEGIVKDMLDVIDNFERAIAQFGNMESLDQNTKNILIGIDMIYKDLKNILKKHGVEELELKGQIFDPTLAEAVDTIQDDNFGPDEIVEVITKGYRLHDKVIRAARVVVNVAREEIT
ncbi:GrpE protein [Hydrogenobaculum sp. Y04AAS1]|uniref:nucleotide exchange factor GrpE n=1 Tax=Hydrogenobaculum sp. (strain Y04AAS1) TaxID=380749 RepID=UPI00015BC64B|nr:GrpE protein [Hydrogenobaculum sp. Y04AAS1]HCT66855.1 nucleotide exchange factor GrpE [Hydrogenobaculum sp.]